MVGGFTAERADQHLGDLLARHHTIGGAGVSMSVALQEYKLLLVWIVVVEPSGAHNGVFVAADSYQAFRTSLPIVGLRGAIVVGVHIGHADGGHECDACFASVERQQRVADGAVIDFLDHAWTIVGAHGEHHAVDIDQCFSQRCDIGQIALENFRARIEAGLQWIAYQRSYGIALSYGLVYGKSADTAGAPTTSTCVGFVMLSP